MLYPKLLARKVFERQEGLGGMILLIGDDWEKWFIGLFYFCVSFLPGTLFPLLVYQSEGFLMRSGSCCICLFGIDQCILGFLI